MTNSLSSMRPLLISPSSSKERERWRCIEISPGRFIVRAPGNGLRPANANHQVVLPPSTTREEMRTFARGEFERNKFVYDLGHIRYLISTGKTQFDSMKRYIEQNAL